MKNWRTTLAGCVLAACMAIDPIISTGEIDYKRLLFAGGVAVVSYLAKDAGVTGGER